MLVLKVGLPDVFNKERARNVPKNTRIGWGLLANIGYKTSKNIVGPEDSVKYSYPHFQYIRETIRELCESIDALGPLARHPGLLHLERHSDTDGLLIPIDFPFPCGPTQWGFIEDEWLLSSSSLIWRFLTVLNGRLDFVIEDAMEFLEGGSFDPEHDLTLEQFRKEISDLQHLCYLSVRTGLPVMFL